ncbi:Na(+)/H(+) antiporter subunit C [Streptomyces sp. NPDC003077]|uniref:Na(+)/H(+) antiporter subunit C n=1 Tax=Streptomyces sp. NPDC003077 TaxID=3154443 RepID=UPI0033B7FABA
MTVTLALLATGAVLISTGVTLLLARALTRILLGAILVGNGVNLLVLSTGGPAGPPPLLGSGTGPKDVTDPLPQAMILTAIVITLAMTGFLLAMAYRNWQLTGGDEVEDDIEDRRVARRAIDIHRRAAREAEDHRARAGQRRHSSGRHHSSGRRRPAGRGARRTGASTRSAYRSARRGLRREIRVERARRTHSRHASGDLWDGILGEDW